MKIAADVLGYVVTFLSIIATQFPRRSQMLVCNATVNFLGAVSMLLLTGISSAAVMNLVAVAQVLMNLRHHTRDEAVSLRENIVFMALYLICGILGFRAPLDMIPMIGVSFFLLSVIQHKEQRMRLFSLINVLVYLIYYILIGSTLVYAQTFSAISIIIALYRYRKQK